MDAVPRPSSRGRSRHHSLLRQSTLSEPPSALSITRDLLERTSWPNLRHRGPNSAANTPHVSMPPSPPFSGSDPEDSMDTGDEEELLFWGGESPRSRLTSPVSENGMSIDDSDEDDEDGEESEDASEVENMSDNDDIETDEYNRMEFIGHR